jgi:hypothetical protein
MYIKIELTYIRNSFWIHPGTFYGICAPHKLSASKCFPNKRKIIQTLIKLVKILRMSH